LNGFCPKGHEQFHAEKDALLEVGPTNLSYITVDDRGARHKDKNGYVTHIGDLLIVGD